MPIPCHEKRRALRLSDPKTDGGSSPLPFSIDISSVSSLSEADSSPAQSPQTKRTNDESEKEASQTSLSSSASSDGNRMKKFKRRNQAIYSSTEEDA